MAKLTQSERVFSAANVVSQNSISEVLVLSLNDIPTSAPTRGPCKYCGQSNHQFLKCYFEPKPQTSNFISSCDYLWPLIFQSLFPVASPSRRSKHDPFFASPLMPADHRVSRESRTPAVPHPSSRTLSLQCMINGSGWHDLDHCFFLLSQPHIAHDVTSTSSPSATSISSAITWTSSRSLTIVQFRIVHHRVSFVIYTGAHCLNACLTMASAPFTGHSYSCSRC